MASGYTLYILILMIFLLGFLLLMILLLGMELYSIYWKTDQERAMELPVSKTRKGVKISKEQAQDQCSICLEELVSKKRKIAVLRSCDHMFHFPCIVEWARESQSCPLCRQVVDRVVVSKIRKKLLDNLENNNGNVASSSATASTVV